MVEPIIGALIAFVVGGLAGAFSSYLGWNKSGEPFDRRKFIDGLSTGVIGGVALVFANLAGFKVLTDDFAFIALIGTIFLGALGVDTIREGISTSAVKSKTPDTNKSSAV